MLRRYYRRECRYPYYFHPEIKSYHEFVSYAEAHPDVDCFSLDNAEYAIGGLSHEEQESMWRDSVRRVMLSTRDVLDNLEFLYEFQVRWNYYGSKRFGVGKPPENTTFIS